MATKKLNIPGLEKGLTIMRVPPAQIMVDEADNSRQIGDDIAPLVDALITAGRQLHPVGVERVDGGLKLIWGYRRWKALSFITENSLVQPGDPLSMLECVVVEESMTESQAFLINVLENAGRKELSPMEIAKAMKRMTTELEPKYTLKEAAAPWNKSKAWASSMIRLLELPVSIQRKVDSGLIPVSAAYDVLTMPEGQEREAALVALDAGEGTTRSKVREAVRQQDIANTPEVEADPNATPAPPAKPVKGDKKKRTLKELAVAFEEIRTKYTETAEDGTESFLPIAVIMDELVRFMAGGTTKRFERSVLKVVLRED